MNPRRLQRATIFSIETLSAGLVTTSLRASPAASEALSTAVISGFLAILGLLLMSVARSRFDIYTLYRASNRYGEAPELLGGNKGMDQGNSQAGSTFDLRGVPALPFRAGRHLSAWIKWHVARVSLNTDELAPVHAPEKLTGAGERTA